MPGPELLVSSGAKARYFCDSSGIRTSQPGRAKSTKLAYPVRTCLGCGIKSNKAELVRLVVSAGVLVADRMQVLPGRGVYCCRNHQCYQRLVKQRKKLAWALRFHETEKVGNLALSQGLEVQFATS